MPELNIEQALIVAAQRRQAGDLRSAESLCRQILQLDPNHAQALHLLGIIAHQTANNTAAVDLIRRSLLIQPASAEAHNNLGSVYKSLGQLTEAAASFRRAVKLKPDFAEAYCNVGAVLRELERFDDAIAALQMAVTLRPRYARAYNDLGMAFMGSGRFDRATSALRTAISFDDNLVESHRNLGLSLAEIGELPEAIAECEHALTLKPDCPDTLNNLAIALVRSARTDEAIELFRRALELRPGFVAALLNLGNALHETGRLDEAISTYREALITDFEDGKTAGIWCAHSRRRDFAGGFSNLGNALSDKGRFDDAIVSYRQALALEPDYALAHSNLGNAYKESGRIAEAIECYRTALSLKPDFYIARSNLLCCLHYRAAADDQEIFEEHRQWNRRHALPLPRVRLPADLDRASDRPLRIGYVSPDFREHSVSFFFEGLLAAHDKRQIETFCYADGPKPDQVTQRLEKLADHWRPSTALNNEHLIERIVTDRIDILVDLAGHTAGNRLLVFARKPAPVQVSYLGYIDTSGLDAIDYRLTDEHLDPRGQTDRFHAERLVRIPDTFTCYRPPDNSPELIPPPCLSNGRITFGVFNGFAKITPEALATWAEIISQVPGSRLLMVNAAMQDAGIRARVLRAFEDAGVAGERLELIARRPLGDFLALYNQVDILLDTFPVNGHTITCHGLWMGVPTVCLAGTRYWSRLGVSVMSNLGLHDLIAPTTQHYVQLAARLAEDPARLTELRATLRHRMAGSPLMDASAFARKIESAYRDMWRAFIGQNAADPA